MFIFNILTIPIVLISLLLIGVILLQEPKEQTTAYGGGSTPVQRIGINQKADFLEKTTWVLVGLLLFLILLSSLALKSSKKNNPFISPNLEKLKEDQKAIDLNKVEEPSIPGLPSSNEKEQATPTQH